MIRQLFRRSFAADLYRGLRFVWNNGPKYRHIASYQNIPGYLTVNEAKALYDAASSLPPADPVIVEIGSHLGRSSSVLAKALHGKSGGRLYCIDPFDASGDESAAKDYESRAASSRLSLLERFKANMRRRGVAELVTPLSGLSHEVSRSFAVPEIDMLFIDGNHDYPAVKEDFEDWAPRLAKGGILAMHDVFATPFDGHYDGPWKVLEQRVLNKPEWKWFRLIDTLAVVQKC